MYTGTITCSICMSTRESFHCEFRSSNYEPVVSLYWKSLRSHAYSGPLFSPLRSCQVSTRNCLLQSGKFCPCMLHSGPCSKNWTVLAKFLLKPYSTRSVTAKAPLEQLPLPATYDDEQPSRPSNEARTTYNNNRYVHFRLRSLSHRSYHQ